MKASPHTFATENSAIDSFNLVANPNMISTLKKNFLERSYFAN
jgi:hypothetical protein